MNICRPSSRSTSAPTCTAGSTSSSGSNSAAKLLSRPSTSSRLCRTRARSVRPVRLERRHCSAAHVDPADLDAVTDADERKAACSTIHSFGQTPRQLFAKPHPARRPRLRPRSTHPLFAPDLAVEQSAPTLIQCISPIISLASTSPIASIHPPSSSSAPEKVRVEQQHVLAVPHVAGLTLQHGFLDGSLRIFDKGVSVPITLQEGGHTSKITAASFADDSMLVTGSDECVLFLLCSGHLFSWLTSSSLAALRSASGDSRSASSARASRSTSASSPRCEDSTRARSSRSPRARPTRSSSAVTHPASLFSGTSTAPRCVRRPPRARSRSIQLTSSPLPSQPVRQLPSHGECVQAVAIVRRVSLLCVILCTSQSSADSSSSPRRARRPATLRPAPARRCAPGPSTACLSRRTPWAVRLIVSQRLHGPRCVLLADLSASSRR